MEDVTAALFALLMGLSFGSDALVGRRRRYSRPLGVLLSLAALATLFVGVRLPISSGAADALIAVCAVIAAILAWLGLRQAFRDERSRTRAKAG